MFITCKSSMPVSCNIVIFFLCLLLKKLPSFISIAGSRVFIGSLMLISATAAYFYKVQNYIFSANLTAKLVDAAGYALYSPH